MLNSNWISPPDFGGLQKNVNISKNHIFDKNKKVLKN